MSTLDRARAIVEPLVADLDLSLYDLELNGGILRVVVDQPGGVGMDAITALTKAISRAVDEHDPIESSFTLEVSSPGLERVLRTPGHFRAATGTKVTIKTIGGLGGERRVTGLLSAVDDEGIVVDLEPGTGEQRRLGFDQIDRARTVFEWGPTPKPGGPKQAAPKKSSAPHKKVTAS